MLKDIKIAQKRRIYLKKPKQIVMFLCERKELPKRCISYIFSGNYSE
jgi:hypothetical protein